MSQNLQNLLTETINWSFIRRKEVMTKFGLGLIPEDVYTVTRKNLDEQIDEIGAEITTLEKQSSNQVIDTRKAILISCQLADYWKEGTYETKQNIQDLVFPDGLHWDRESDNYRTITENEAIRVFRLFSSSYKNGDIQKKDKSFDLSSLVDQTLRISNLTFIEGLLQIQSFIDELDR